MKRLIALGASNLTRGFSTLVGAVTQRGEPIEVFGALGHGRSYGIKSRVLVRTLPGILESGLWDQLASLARVPTRAFVTDVGNDILYHVPVPTILGWVAECVARLRRQGAEVTITDMPLFSIERLGTTRFTFFRSLFVPSCRLSLAEVTVRARALNEELLSLARDQGLTLVRLRPDWYGVDPIHIRPKHWAAAWREILAADELEGTHVGPTTHAVAPLRLYLARPEKRWLCGVEQRCEQPAIRTPGGTTVWLY